MLAGALIAHISATLEVLTDAYCGQSLHFFGVLGLFGAHQELSLEFLGLIEPTGAQYGALYKLKETQNSASLTFE